ncbi:MAG: UDP-N-acetylmuramoyl-tripeptide--D-alanyl-D-alanine ligase [Clostridia bacterium]|nr:UDP-N-acetylmuramoyl-tripeptide--D-alanyl-D-alanine ligase [Clostridia bacterium]
MNYWLLISLILFAVGGIFSSQRQLQMFQQNSYFPSRYIKWIKTASSVKTAYCAMFFIITAALSIVKATKYLPIIAIIELILRIFNYRSNSKKSIKKLVYTARIKRLICTFAIVYIALIVLSLLDFLKVFSSIFVIVLLLFVHFSEFLVLSCNYINKPIENAINKHYINDAKRILAQHKNLTTIGVTGSYGKTSVKFILNRILSEGYNTTATPESFNTPMGIVRTVREYMKSHTEIFIAEMGAKNKGDIKELCELCNPSLGIITAVGPQHLETFGSVENVAKTKFELADSVLNRANGKIYVNFDSIPARQYAETITDKSKLVPFGTSADLMCHAENISFSIKGTSFDVVYGNHNFSVTCKLLGKHSVTNILGAIAMALDLGVSEKQIRFAVSSLKPAEHRLELKQFLNRSVLIDDAYNSNPEGCLEAVRVLGSFDGMKRILVTPGLVELGDKEYDYNYALGEEATKHCDYIILVGVKRAVPMQDAISKTSFESSRVIVVESFKDAMTHLKNMTDSNTVVLFENDLPDNYAG